MFNKITENVEVHQTLPDTPNLTTQELKKTWDKGCKIIKEAFNNLVDELNKAKITSTVLYKNTVGTIDRIDLSGNVISFPKLAIEYRYQDIYNTIIVFEPNNKLVSLSVNFSIEEYGAARTQYKVVKIKDNVIENSQFGYLTILEDKNLGGDIKENAIYITKVVGYR